MATTSAVHTRESTPAASSIEDSRHIYTVAAKSLQDCVELLQSLKAAMAVEAQEAQEAQEQEQQRLQRQTNGNNKNDTPAGKSMRDIHHMSRSASQEAEQDLDNPAAAGTGSTVSKPPRAASSLPQAITPCPRSEMYTKPSVLACQGTIGKHVRHLHDHYRLLLATFPLAQVKKEPSLPTLISPPPFTKRSLPFQRWTVLAVLVSVRMICQHFFFMCDQSEGGSRQRPIGGTQERWRLPT